MGGIARGSPPSRNAKVSLAACPIDAVFPQEESQRLGTPRQVEDQRGGSGKTRGGDRERYYLDPPVPWENTARAVADIIFVRKKFVEKNTSSCMTVKRNWRNGTTGSASVQATATSMEAAGNAVFGSWPRSLDFSCEILNLFGTESEIRKRGYLKPLRKFFFRSSGIIAEIVLFKNRGI
jgi:hypothetical protein